jgi:hypothetical protein
MMNFRTSHLGCGRVLMALATATIVLTVTDASAQALRPDAWRQGTMLAGFVGGASPSSNLTPVGGLAVGWEVSPRIAVEGRGAWLGVNQGSSDFFALLATRVSARPGHVLVPFLTAGVGMYRASYESIASDIPAFYRGRMSSISRFESRTFDDFMITLGGGTESFVTSHIGLRPEVTALLVTTSSDARVVPLFGLQLVYHVEARRVTK